MTNRKVYTKPLPPKTDLPQEVIAFFESRGITEEVLRRNKIGAEKTFMPGLGKEVLAIAFPYFENGQVVNIKYRSLDKSFKQVANAKKVFYGLDDIEGDEVLLVEGEMDRLALEVAGYRNVLSVPDGAPPVDAKSYETKFDFLNESQELISRLKKIILAVDNDGPGKKLEDELIRRLGPERCWRVEWPKGCKDANDVLVKEGGFTLAMCIEQARPVPVAGLFEVRDFEKDIDELYENGMEGGVNTGWWSVSQYYTVRPGEWTLVVGIPSHGKSSFVDALTLNLALSHDWRFAFFSPENQPLQRHAAKIAALYIGKPFGSQGHFGAQMSAEEKDEAKTWMQSRFFFVLPPEDELTVEHILAKAKVAVARYGIRGLVIDPWNEIDHSRAAGQTETEYISSALTKIRRFARIHQVHVWVVAHPTKLQKDDKGNYPVPTPYDTAGSAHFRNKADCCLAVWRDVMDEKKKVQIHIQKVRFREVGKPGIAELEFDHLTGRYSDPEGLGF